MGCDVTVHEMRRHTTPDMQAIQDDIDKHLEPLRILLDIMNFVEPVDKTWLSASQNNFSALERTLKLAIMDRTPAETPWEAFEK